MNWESNFAHAFYLLHGKYFTYAFNFRNLMYQKAQTVNFTDLFPCFVVFTWSFRFSYKKKS